MTLLSDLAARLEASASSQRSADQQLQQTEHLREIAETLARRLSELVAQRPFLVQPPLADLVDAPALSSNESEAVAAMGEFEARLDAGLSALKQDQRWRRLDSQLRSLARVYTEQVESARQRFVGSLPQAQPPDVEDPEVAQEVAKLRRLISEIASLSTSRPSSPAELEKLGRLAHEAEELAERLEQGFPDSVRRFLAGTRRPAGADLSMLDEEVREWLAKKGMIGQLGVIRRDSGTR